MKRELRKRMRSLLRQVSPTELGQRSREACQKLINSALFQSATTVAAFYHMPSNEVETTELLRVCFDRGKQVFLPRIEVESAAGMTMLEAYSFQDVEGWPTNPMGIREPPTLFHEVPRREVFSMIERHGQPLDLVVVPGLAFDAFGHRLGRGKGYYDTFLSKCDMLHRQYNLPSPRRVGLALSCQMVSQVPVTAHDQSVEAVFHA